MIKIFEKVHLEILRIFIKVNSIKKRISCYQNPEKFTEKFFFNEVDNRMLRINSIIISVLNEEGKSVDETNICWYDEGGL